jgi:hypothetical protein
MMAAAAAALRCIHHEEGDTLGATKGATDSFTEEIDQTETDRFPLGRN